MTTNQEILEVLKRIEDQFKSSHERMDNGLEFIRDGLFSIAQSISYLQKTLKVEVTTSRGKLAKIIGWWK